MYTSIISQLIYLFNKQIINMEWTRTHNQPPLINRSQTIKVLLLSADSDWIFYKMLTSSNVYQVVCSKFWLISLQKFLFDKPIPMSKVFFIKSFTSTVNSSVTFPTGTGEWRGWITDRSARSAISTRVLITHTPITYKPVNDTVIAYQPVNYTLCYSLSPWKLLKLLNYIHCYSITYTNITNHPVNYKHW